MSKKTRATNTATKLMRLAHSPTVQRADKGKRPSLRRWLLAIDQYRIHPDRVRAFAFAALLGYKSHRSRDRIANAVYCAGRATEQDKVTALRAALFGAIEGLSSTDDGHRRVALEQARRAYADSYKTHESKGRAIA